MKCPDCGINLDTPVKNCTMRHSTLIKEFPMKGNRMWENADGERSLDPCIPPHLKFADIRPNIVYPSPTHVYIRNPRWFIFGFIIGIGIGLFISVLL